jgi:dolichol-phosphate mannosyltransferase
MTGKPQAGGPRGGAPELSVVVPTLDEAEAIDPLLRDLADALSGVPHEVIVVDDGSTDGTPEAARRSHPRVRVIERGDARGLATAVVRGLREARGTHVLVMDGDGQHPPEAAPRLLAAARERGADLVTGSRRVEGGADEGLEGLRRLVSWGAEGLARLALPSVRGHGLSDPMSGFFLVRRDAVDPDALDPRGYKILLEILVRGDVDEVVEVPYRFRERAAGESNLGLGSSLAYLAHLGELAWAERGNRRAAAFAVVGAVGVLLNLAVLAGLVEGLGVAPGLAVVASVEASIVHNWFWNDVWTFRDRRQGSLSGRLARFNAVSLVAMGANVATFMLLFGVLGIGYLAAEALAIGVAWLANYGVNLEWTYGDRTLPTALSDLPGIRSRGSGTPGDADRPEGDWFHRLDEAPDDPEGWAGEPGPRPSDDTAEPDEEPERPPRPDPR